MSTQSIVWRSDYLTGHEYCRVYWEDEHWHVIGAAVFSKDNQPSWLEYLVECDPLWVTLGANVSGWVGEQEIDLEITVDQDQVWILNGVEQPLVKGCIDIDLNFSPATNLLPIRRCALEVGEEAEVRAAWLKFPSFKFELLDQKYKRTEETTFRYESGGGKFIADLKVNSFGLVTSYPGIWEQVSDVR